MTTKETSRHRQSTVTVVRKFKVHWRRLSEVSKCVHLPGNPSGIFPLWGICHRKSTQGWGWGLGHFRIAHSFCFKERLSAMIFNSHANKFHFHEKGFALSFKARYFGTRKGLFVIVFFKPKYFEYYAWPACPTVTNIREGAGGQHLDLIGTAAFWPSMMCW